MAESVLVYPVDVRASSSASLNNAVPMSDQKVGVLPTRQARVGNAERTNLRLPNGCKLGRSSADAVVFHQHKPTISPRQSQPVFVGDLLTFLLAVDRRQRVNSEPLRSKRIGHDVTTEAPIDEELRVRLRRGSTSHAWRPRSLPQTLRSPQRVRHSTRQPASGRERPRRVPHRARRWADRTQDAGPR